MEVSGGDEGEVGGGVGGLVVEEELAGVGAEYEQYTYVHTMLSEVQYCSNTAFPSRGHQISQFFLFLLSYGARK
jgi:hypothetical protein